MNQVSSLLPLDYNFSKLFKMTTALFEAAQKIETQGGDKRKELPIAPAVSPNTLPNNDDSAALAPPTKKQTTDRTRAIRLEQNRKAARESRRRKKKMIEELQRSLMFFSKANEKLKQENEAMTRQLLDAHSKLASMGKQVPAVETKGESIEANKPPEEVATAPVLDIDGQIGSTMQAMANFQQAAHIAMEAASRHMQAQGVVLNPASNQSKPTNI